MSDNNCPISSNSSQSPEQKELIDAFLKKPEVKQLMDQAGMIPAWTLASASSLFLLTEWAIRSGRLETNRPRLMKFGSVLVGGMAAIQVSMLRLRWLLSELDPNGQLQREAKDLFAKLRDKKVNQYGDSTDEFK